MSARDIVIFLCDGLLGFAASVASGGLISINIRDSFVLAIAVFGCFFIVYSSICALQIFVRLRIIARVAACFVIAAFLSTLLSVNVKII
jgi:hypothetical protein